jgi:hypothetical protein
VCEMSDAGFSSEAMEFIKSKWHPSDPFRVHGRGHEGLLPSASGLGAVSLIRGYRGHLSSYLISPVM